MFDFESSIQIIIKQSKQPTLATLSNGS
jgi:hypothetical protein